MADEPQGVGDGKLPVTGAGAIAARPRTNSEADLRTATALAEGLEGGRGQPDSPARQPRPSPINGVVPPVEHQWKPGQSGNPEGGWTKELPPTGPALRRALSKLLTQNPGKAEAIVAAMVDRASCGDVKAATLLWDREDGRPQQKIEHSGNVTRVTITGPEDSP